MQTARRTACDFGFFENGDVLHCRRLGKMQTNSALFGLRYLYRISAAPRQNANKFGFYCRGVGLKKKHSPPTEKEWG
ncbi:MAG: hypothetical protein K2P00_00565, partial [Alistipes sp.]|nr:hypothetical protein [Alistipes sp.]